MDDRQLSELLTDAVADVEPLDRLAEVRERVARPARPRRWYAVGGTVLAAAAVVTAVAVVGNPLSTSDGGVGPAESPSSRDDPGSDSPLYAVYYFGDTPQGTRLFREWQRQYGNGGSLAVASQLVSLPPDDPDYRTVWPEGAFTGADIVTVNGRRVIEVDTGMMAWDRPQGLSRADAELAVQQVVYTMQAVVQDDTLPVVFFVAPGQRAETLYGVDVTKPVDTAPQLDVLSLMSISNPVEHQVVDGSFVADGRARSFEGNVLWELRDADTGDVVLDGFTTAGQDDHLVEWKTEPIDVSDLVPGTYTFVASTTDPSDGEGAGVFTDTRTIVVQ
jgi:hypothetical protein